MSNQVVLPATQVAAPAYAPYTQSTPYSAGPPIEGPRTTVVNVAIPAGQLLGTLNVNLTLCGMSQARAILIDNQSLTSGITVKAGQTGVTFGVQPFGTQIVPVFQTGTNLLITVLLDTVEADTLTIPVQIFNDSVPPAAWVSSLNVSGSVNIANASGGVKVEVSNAGTLAVAVAAEPYGGASSALVSLTNTPVLIKPQTGRATFKGVCGLSTAAGWLQIFDAYTVGGVVLGTTPPLLSIPVVSNILTTIDLPPEGIVISNGVVTAFTTTFTGAAAPAANWQGNVIYA